jgi:SAM-dependent methyltransferase
MAHDAQREFVGYLLNRYPGYFTEKKVLEVGSLNLNGTVRDFFTNCDYTGLDVGPGLCVDVVCSGHEYDAPDNSFDTICSLECFEHNPYWVETFANMIRMCRPGGLVFFTCATTGRAEHGTVSSGSIGESPLTINLGWEYYRNLTQEDFLENFDMPKYFSEYYFVTNPAAFDLYFFGVKSA